MKLGAPKKASNRRTRLHRPAAEHHLLLPHRRHRTTTTSHYRAGQANGEVAFSPEPNPSITTEPPQAPPTAEDLAVTDITATSAHFSATVDPNAPAGPLSPARQKSL